jgi:hypothetical protein
MTPEREQALQVIEEALRDARCRCEKRVKANNCPQCGELLFPVAYRGGALNEEQFMAVRAGDYYCKTCKGIEAATGFKYFWEREFEVEVHTCKRCAAIAALATLRQGEAQQPPAEEAQPKPRRCQQPNNRLCDCPECQPSAPSPERTPGERYWRDLFRQYTDAALRAGVVFSIGKDNYRAEYNPGLAACCELSDGTNPLFPERTPCACRKALEPLINRLDNGVMWTLFDQKTRDLFLEARAALQHPCSGPQQGPARGPDGTPAEGRK